MKVTLVWAKYDKKMTYLLIGLITGVLTVIVMCPNAQVIVHHPNRNTTFHDQK